MIFQNIETIPYLVYGIPIAVGVTALVMLALQACNSKKNFNAGSYMLGVILCAVLSYQMSRLVGACETYNNPSVLQRLTDAVAPQLSGYLSTSDGHELGWFIFRRVAWSLLYVVLASVGIVLTMDKQYRRTGRPDGFRTTRPGVRPTVRRR